MKKVYIWVFIIVLLIGFIIMSLILVQGLIFVKNITEDFIRFMKELFERLYYVQKA